MQASIESRVVTVETPAAAAEQTAPPPPVREEPFSEAERALFKEEDKLAARGVICIMLAIFTAALIGYTGIWLWVLFDR
jgi:hypothetical protein